MKFQEIPVEQFSVRVKSTESSSLDGLFARHAGPVPVARIEASETENSFDLALANSWAPVTPTKEADAGRLNRELSLGRAMLAQLSGAAPDGSVVRTTQMRSRPGSDHAIFPVDPVCPKVEGEQPGQEDCMPTSKPSPRDSIPVAL